MITNCSALLNLVGNRHAKDKVLIFTQFADTARYLAREMSRAGVTQIEAGHRRQCRSLRVGVPLLTTIQSQANQEER